MWKSYALNIVKAAAVMFTVGMLLAYSAPMIASMTGVSLGMLGTATNPLWTGAYFGAFGGLSAAATPLISNAVDKISAWITGKSKLDLASTELRINPGPVVMAEAKHHGVELGTQYQDMIAAQKAAAASMPTHGHGM